MSRKTVVTVQNLSKKYHLYKNRKVRLIEALHPLRKKYHTDFWALHDISLGIGKGEILGIVGRNGSGKSTLLKAIAGVSTPSRGHVGVQGRVAALLELGSGFNPEFTGIENIYFLGSINGYSRREVDGMVEDIVEFTDIGEYITQPVKTYSSGMKTRLAFAVSTVVEPDVLILDEVLAVGDELFKRKCYARMEALMAGGTTVLYVSHTVSSINELCTRAVLLENGKLLLDGPPKMVTAYYQKLLYAPAAERERVLQEIGAVNEDETKKESFAQQEKDAGEERSIFAEGQAQNSVPPQDGGEDLRPCYVEGFKPASTVEYKNEMVGIHDCVLRTLDLEPVNHLPPGGEYIFEYKVTFRVDVEDISFGMQMKTEKGLVLSAVNSYLLSKKRLHAGKGSVYRVRYIFENNLLPGTYYLNAGVSRESAEEPPFLSRVVDALCFKVIASDRTSWGLVDVRPRADITVLD